MYVRMMMTIGDEEIRRLSKPNRLSYEGRTVDALALGADEGRY